MGIESSLPPTDLSTYLPAFLRFLYLDISPLCLGWSSGLRRDSLSSSTYRCRQDANTDPSYRVSSSLNLSTYLLPIYLPSYLCSYGNRMKSRLCDLRPANHGSTYLPYLPIYLPTYLSNYLYREGQVKKE